MIAGNLTNSHTFRKIDRTRVHQKLHKRKEQKAHLISDFATYDFE